MSTVSSQEHIWYREWDSNPQSTGFEPARFTISFTPACAKGRSFTLLSTATAPWYDVHPKHKFGVQRGIRTLTPFQELGSQPSVSTVSPFGLGGSGGIRTHISQVKGLPLPRQATDPIKFLSTHTLCSPITINRARVRLLQRMPPAHSA